VIDTGETFAWGCLGLAEPRQLHHISERWHSEGREQDEPYFGWFSSELGYTPTTINLKANLRSQPVGFRPLVELEPTDHRWRSNNVTAFSPRASARSPRTSSTPERP